MSSPRAVDRKGSERFNAPGADVIFQSSDNVLFNIHRKNLEVHAPKFTELTFETVDEIEVVQLTEDSPTLELLFQFIYHQPPPELKAIPFVTLMSLAEAAEKYELFHAIDLCHTRFTSIFLDERYVNEILKYAGKHGRLELIDGMTPRLLRKPLPETATYLSDELFKRWVRYYDLWRDVLQHAISRQISNSDMICTNDKSRVHYEAIMAILRKLGHVDSLLNLDALFSLDGIRVCYGQCEKLKYVTGEWRKSVESRIKRIKPFSDPSGGMYDEILFEGLVGIRARKRVVLQT